MSKENRPELKIGVIGVGHMGHYHVNVIAGLATHNLVGVYDTSQERLDFITQRYDTQAFTDMDELMKLCDAVTIAVPTRYHFEVAKKALNHGCHVLLEKPITETVEQAVELTNLARQKNLILQVGHVERFNGAVIELQKVVKAPLLIEAKRLAPFSSRISDVGVILDMMIHDLDIVLNLVNSPVKKYHAVGRSVFSQHEDIAILTLEFENNCVASLVASRASQNKERTLDITEEKSYIQLNYTSQDIEIYRQASSATFTSKEEIKYSQESFLEKVYVHKDNPLKSEHEFFYACVMNEKKPMVPAEKDIETLKIALDSIAQIKAGKA